MGSDERARHPLIPPALPGIAALLRPPRPLSAARPSDDRTPDDVFAAVSRKPYPVYLWGDGAHRRGRFSIVTHSPYACVRPAGTGSVLVRGTHRRALPPGSLGAVLDAVPADGGDADFLPFAGGAIGYIGYEYALGLAGRSRLGKPAPLPAFHFAFYDHAFVFDHHARQGFWVGARQPEPKPAPPRKADARSGVGAWQAAVDRTTYRRHVSDLLGHIAAGDIYQGNYTVRFSAEGQVDPAALALRLRSENPSPMGAFLGYPFGSIWSCSPERLLAVDPCGRLESIPIKGTRSRDTDPRRDRALREALRNDAKERAELLMIVDLVRNDLGRVARPGTVRVDELYRIESYANVHHLEAAVTARQQPGGGVAAALCALLPGGSVTGAPKRRAVEILAGLEPAARCVYTGALGYVSSSGRSDFSLPIRTLYHDNRRFYLHSGGGIVADSAPEREWEEMQIKVCNIRRIVEAACTPS